MKNNRTNVAIVGAGLIGRAWAAIFARAGWNVRLTDPHAPTLAAAPGLIRDELHALARHGLADDPDGAAARISVAASLAGCREGRRIRPGKRPRKRRAEDQRSSPNSTGWRRRTRCWCPRPRRSWPRASPKRCRAGRAAWSAIPSIRRIWCRWSNCAARRGPRPRRSTRAREIYREIGQVPVTVNREINGFVLNRLQGALLAEAFRLVGEGYISAEDLDHTVKDGLGLRWSFLGPFETIELNAPGGIPDYCARYTGFYKELASGVRRPRGLPEPECGPGDRGVAAPADAGTHRRADAAAQRAPRGAGRAQGSAARQILKYRPARKRSKTMSRKVIITCAVTGAIHTPSMSKALPVTPQEIADAAVDAAEAGAAIVHLHARNPEDRPARPEPGSLRAVPEDHQAALELRDQPHHRRRADHDGGRARASRRGLQAGGRLAQHGLDEFRVLRHAQPLQEIRARLGAQASREQGHRVPQHLPGHRIRAEDAVGDRHALRVRMLRHRASLQPRITSSSRAW